MEAITEGKTSKEGLPPAATEQTNGDTKANHHRVSSSLSDFSLLEIDFSAGQEGPTVNQEDNVTDLETMPKETLVIVTETGKLNESVDEAQTIIPNLVDTEFEFLPEDGRFQVADWKGKKGYSDYIQEGLKYKKQDGKKQVIMLYESPGTSTTTASFHNKDKYKIHDWPPAVNTLAKGMIGPCRYACMNGSSYPLFLRNGEPPEGLMEHWQEFIPDFVAPSFVDKINMEEDTVYAYFPVEAIKNHINDPHTHYHLAGKDSIIQMTQKTTRILPDTRTTRPCVVKTTHSMGSKGIFIITDDKDEEEFLDYLDKSGNPSFVVTDFIDISRNVACHFFIHPKGSIVWFGSNENMRDAEGRFSTDSYLMMEHQLTLKQLQLPFVEEIAKYCHSIGFWGFCGVDVLFDSQGRGHLVDINPRVTGSGPALMVLKRLQDKYGFMYGLFRRQVAIYYHGKAQDMLAEVKAENLANEGDYRIVIFAFHEKKEKNCTQINIGVFGNSIKTCTDVLNKYAKKIPA